MPTLPNLLDHDVGEHGTKIPKIVYGILICRGDRLLLFILSLQLLMYKYVTCASALNALK